MLVLLCSWVCLVKLVMLMCCVIRFVLLVLVFLLSRCVWIRVFCIVFVLDWLLIGLMLNS